MDEPNDRGVPQLARGLLGDVLAVVRSTLAIPIVNTAWADHEFSFHLVPMMAGYSGRAGGAAREDSKGWLEEMRRLGAEGRYFFSINRYLVVADKPGS